MATLTEDSRPARVAWVRADVVALGLLGLVADICWPVLKGGFV